jgi:AmiR/NasT family two-component response regulator
MNRGTIPTVRGRHALVLLRDEPDIAVVRRQLDRLGMGATVRRPGEAEPETAEVDLVFLDVDAAPETGGAWCLGERVPIVAVVGTETPSRLKWMLDQEPAAVLIKPLRSAGLYTAVVVALHQGQRRRETDAHIEKLEGRVRSRRTVSSAIVRVMTRYGLSEPDAFALVRRAAMQRRTTLEHVCAEIAGDGELPLRTGSG